MESAGRVNTSLVKLLPKSVTMEVDRRQRSGRLVPAFGPATAAEEDAYIERMIRKDHDADLPR